MMLRNLAPAMALVAAACASSGSPDPGTSTRPAKSFLREGSAPGFDKRDFPGLAAMETWMRESPYVWVGYYLPSPCYAGQAWTGNRAALSAMGWGLAVIYVGQQAPGATANAGAAGAPDCGKKPLTAEQGALDGAQAVAIATADGFSAGTTIYLDIERSDPMPAAVGDYARGWITSVLSRGFVAGIYAHKLNARHSPQSSEVRSRRPESRRRRRFGSRTALASRSERRPPSRGTTSRPSGRIHPTPRRRGAESPFASTRTSRARGYPEFVTGHPERGEGPRLSSVQVPRGARNDIVNARLLPPSSSWPSPR